MLLSQLQKKQVRNTIFRHLDGIVIAPTINALEQKKILSYLSLKKTGFTLRSIIRKYGGNIGYINVAFRLLSSQGYLKRTDTNNHNDLNFKFTSLGYKFTSHLELFNNSIKWYETILRTSYYTNNNIANADIDLLNEITKKAKENWTFRQKDYKKKSIEYQLIKQLNGIIIGLFMVPLVRNKIIFNQDYLSKIISTNIYWRKIFDIFELINWVKINNDKCKITPIGEYAFNIGASYGVTVSYLPTFINLHNQFFKKSKVFFKLDHKGNETHVDRSMNVWGSGGAHQTYFKEIDKLIINIFNKPINEQPLGIADMGCGDGNFLKHLYNTIITKTIRKNYLKEHPLYIIGADLNYKAIEAAKVTLSRANIKHTMFKATINNPNNFAKNVKEKLNYNLNMFLNVRSFLDHNRKYIPPKNIFNNHISKSSCAFCFNGKWISNNKIEHNLIEHFKLWKPYINKFGLIFIELHSCSPEITYSNLGKSITTAYDATHGYTDQYILEYTCMKECIEKSNLKINHNVTKLYPNDNSTAISINHIY